jgi:hypothetical protein
VGLRLSSNAGNVSQLITAAFNLAKGRLPQQYQQWVDASYAIGGLLPNSMLVSSVQKEGEIDLVLRCMEAEAMQTPGEASPLFTFHYQSLLSASWVGGCYEILRTLRQREMERVQRSGGQMQGLVASPGFADLFRDLELLRVSLEKHEIPKDNKLSAPMQMARVPSSEEPRDAYVYDKADDKRAHIMPMGISANGSVMWQVLDHARQLAYWVERRDLSSRLLAVASRPHSANSQK